MKDMKKTHCKYNHEFTPENTRRDKSGYKQCKTCDVRRSKSFYRDKVLNKSEVVK